MPTPADTNLHSNTPATPTVILTSGGLDSTTCLAIARAESRRLFCLTVDYGQTHKSELDAAAHVARAFGAERHLVARVNLDAFGGSSLTGDMPAPLNRTDNEIATGGIPSTYVPARNTVFLSLAMAWAETLGAADIFIGVNALDYSGYPDCRPEFIEAFERMATLATRAGVEGGPALKIHTPLIRLTKAQIIKLGVSLGVDYAMTHTCYFPSANGNACGACDACHLRRKGFAEAGLVDPIDYDSVPGGKSK